MKYRTILFTDVNLETAGIVVINKEKGIERHACKVGKTYIHAFLLEDNGFQPLHYSISGMIVQDAIDRIAW